MSIAAILAHRERDAQPSGVCPYVRVTATDAVRVERLELYVNGTLHDSRMATSSATFGFYVGEGTCVVEARAFDISRNVGVSATHSVTAPPAHVRDEAEGVRQVLQRRTCQVHRRRRLLVIACFTGQSLDAAGPAARDRAAGRSGYQESVSGICRKSLRPLRERR